jgi:hypothetical protein
MAALTLPRGWIKLNHIVNVPDPERLTRDGSYLAGEATIDAGEQHRRVTQASRQPPDADAGHHDRDRQHEELCAARRD